MTGSDKPHSAGASETDAPKSADPSLLWDEFARPLRAFLARRVPAGMDAEDLVQEVFTRVVRHAATLREADRPDAWLFQIARNALRDALRARQRKDNRTDSLDIDLPAEQDTDAERAAVAELAPCVTPMIRRLAEPYRTAIELTAVEGLTQEEAAKRTAISVPGMKSRVQRGRQQLKQMLVNCCEIQVDVRGGVSDFHLRTPESCNAPPATTQPRMRRKDPSSGSDKTGRSA